MKGLSLGADLGGTSLRLCLADSGRVLKRLKTRGGPWPGLPDMLRPVLARWGRPRLARLVVGGKGLGRAEQRRALRRALKGFAAEITLMSDLELSHRAAFSGGPGVLVIGGTGSSALGRDASGRSRMAGGWGPLIGDEGSGFWIGKRALKDAALSKLWPADTPLKVGRGKDPVRQTAALAGKVLSRARKGDAAARRLRREAARELAALAIAAANGLPRPAALVLHGGLFDDPGLKGDFLAALPRRRFALQSPDLAPEVAAAAL